MMISAVRPADQMLDRDFLPTRFDVRSFFDIWSTGFGNNLRISLEVAGGSTVLVLLVAIPAAYYTARQRFRGRGLFMLLVLVTQMFQPTAMLVGIYREFLSFGMIDTVSSLILVNAGFNMAFAVWILNAYVSAIPQELEEAAFIDGSTRLGALFRVTLPARLAGHRHRPHLHLHRRLERVHRGADADDLLDDGTADGDVEQLHRPVFCGLAPSLCGFGDRDHPGHHPLRPDRGESRRRSHRRLY